MGKEIFMGDLMNGMSEAFRSMFSRDMEHKAWRDHLAAKVLLLTATEKELERFSEDELEYIKLIADRRHLNAGLAYIKITFGDGIDKIEDIKKKYNVTDADIAYILKINKDFYNGYEDF